MRYDLKRVEPVKARSLQVIHSSRRHCLDEIFDGLMFVQTFCFIYSVKCTSRRLMGVIPS